MSSKAVETIYLMGIGGIAMGTLATMLHDLGHRVTGSDQNIYPPMSDHLEALGIELHRGYSEENIVRSPADLYVIGNVIRRENPEAQKVLQNGAPFLSMPQALVRYFLPGHRSIVVAGTHGKSTTSALLSWLLTSAGRDPSAFVGAFIKNWDRSYRLGHGEYMVFEGDEYDTAFFDKGPKFLHYRPHIAMVTSVEFDHADIFADFEAVRDAFHAFAELIPSDGFLILNADAPHCMALKPRCRGTVITYGWSAEAQWRIQGAHFENGLSHFSFRKPGQSVDTTMTSKLPGRHNIENTMAALIAGHLAGLTDEEVQTGLLTFEGVRRRYDILGEPNGILVIDDFAHHPTAVRETLRAIREFHPGRRLIAAFEPRTNSSRRAVFQHDYAQAFDSADLIYIKEPPQLDSLSPAERLDTGLLVREIKAQGKEAHACKHSDELLKALLSRVCGGDLVVCMSNGSFDGLPKRMIEALRTG